MAATVVVAMALAGMSIDASRWRDAIAQRASDALGRPVMLQGALELEPTLGRELAVKIGPLRILNRPGFVEQEFLAIGELRARIDLFEALRGRLRSSRIEASDVHLRLERGADGTGNWSASPQRDSRPRQPTIDVARIVLHRLGIHYFDARSATRRSVELDELSGSAGVGSSPRLAARGRLEPQLLYALAIEGGPMRLVQDDAGSSPFNVQARHATAQACAPTVRSIRVKNSARVQVKARAEEHDAD